jgi:plastocyanin
MRWPSSSTPSFAPKTDPPRAAYSADVKVGVSIAAVSVAALALVAGFAGAARADNPVLTADVGQSDGFTLTLKDSTGALVTHLDPGTYTLVVHDHSSFHNFDFSGPGAAVSTDVDFVGDKTFTVTLVDGTYFFQCDPHSAQMHGKFTVGTVTAPPTTAPAPAPSVRPLTASIGPGASSSLRPSAGLSAGRYAITVNDRSATDGFRLSGPGIAKATGASFRGKVTWKVKLSAGRYSFGSALHAKNRHILVVIS